jgi:hypothetical protein
LLEVHQPLKAFFANRRRQSPDALLRHGDFDGDTPVRDAVCCQQDDPGALGISLGGDLCPHLWLKFGTLALGDLQRGDAPYGDPACQGLVGRKLIARV